jgi:Transposase DDE domain
MRHVLSSEPGQQLYRKQQMIQPLFAHTKHNRGIKQFHRRDLRAVRTEWRLLMATHDLTKLHRHRIAVAAV